MKVEVDRNIEELVDRKIRERLAQLYFELENPWIAIFSVDDPELEERKVRKLRKAVKRVHNDWFAAPEERL